jgi:cupin fold WbuC family metalloprotein
MFDFITESSPGVFKSKSRPIAINAEFVGWLKDQAAKTVKQRARLCAHLDSDAQVHEMLIALQGGGYVRPHRHFNKSESMHVIEGRAAIIYYSEDGKPLALRLLGSTGERESFYCRTEGAIFHTVHVLGPSFVFHETIQGPFRADATEFAPWAPEENSPGVPAFLRSLEALLKDDAAVRDYLRATLP